VSEDRFEVGGTNDEDFFSKEARELGTSNSRFLADGDAISGACAKSVSKGNLYHSPQRTVGPRRDRNLITR
jgi:hypothetical protein